MSIEDMILIDIIIIVLVNRGTGNHWDCKIVKKYITLIARSDLYSSNI